MENSKIQWCDHTFNCWIGCSRVSDGCLNCYAENLMADRYGRVKWGPKGTRSKVKDWSGPEKWNREAARDGEKHKVFCASLADVFEDWTGPIQDHKGNELWTFGLEGRYEPKSVHPRPRGYRQAIMSDLRRDLFGLIDRTPNLYWLLLTKRPENIGVMWEGSEILESPFRENVWLGTSIASEKDAHFANQLLFGTTLCPVLFLSLEPQIGHVDLKPWLEAGIGWVIVGGESKQGAREPRPFDVRWAEDAVEQCKEHGTPCFIKQLGSNVWRGKRRLTFKDSHGGDWNEWDRSLRVRECPETFAGVMT